MSQDPNHLIWVDLEMTGLDTENDAIIEIATLVTDQALNELAVGPVLAVHQTDAILGTMDEWNREHHYRSGLVERVRASVTGVAEAERQTLAFLERHVPPGASPMCGNSICMDRRFLARHMPTLEAYFHYRNLDVSTLKELARRWVPAVAENFTKESRHLALDDIRESIAELHHYREHLFHLPG